MIWVFYSSLLTFLAVLHTWAAPTWLLSIHASSSQSTTDISHALYALFLDVDAPVRSLIKAECFVFAKIGANLVTSNFVAAV
jgi:hypothetical protein